MMFPTMKNSVFAMTVLAALSSCGGQSFDVVQSQENSGAAGSTSIAPKIDIVLAIDNSGSAIEIQQKLDSSINTFLSSMNNQNWDYRITAIPLIGTSSLGATSASKFDGHSSNWVAPYPGATPDMTMNGYIAPANYAPNIHGSASDGSEPGLRNIGAFLSSSAVQSNFLRADAALAVVVIGNGDDTSWLPANVSGGCASPAQVYYPGTNTPCPSSAAKADVSDVVAAIKASKPSALQNNIHLFPVVANGSTCSGQPSYSGTRYQAAGQALGGHGGIALNLCGSTAMTSLFSSLQSQMAAIQLNFVRNYVQISKRPNENLPITVVKHASNGSTVSIPQSVNGSAGWVYRGMTSVYMISYPIQMDYRTGYMIELIGDAYKLSGSETADVTFQEYGAQASQ